jgi:glycosyltransferase involved in cell wall biosynthesis
LRKIVFIADGRSDHTKRWIQFFVNNSETILISTYDCDPLPGIKTIVLPGKFRMSKQLISDEANQLNQRTLMSRLLAFLLRVEWAAKLWGLLKLLDLFKQSIRVKFLIKQINPDVVHALRIPNEGYLAAFSGHKHFIVSSWGSDFIDTAKNSTINRILTKITLKKTGSFFSDCHRDIDMAIKHGLKLEIPRFVFPGNGGVDMNIFHPPSELCRTHSLLYCRGLSRVTCIETLIISYKMLQESFKDVSLTIMSPIVTHSQLIYLLDKHKVHRAKVNLLDFSGSKKLSELMRNHSIFVSPMLSDGLPNSMLEAMSCGMVPVMSNLTSISEVITNNVNGFLFEASSHSELHTALCSAFQNLDSPFRYDNIKLINDKFNYVNCMEKVSRIYDEKKK